MRLLLLFSLAIGLAAQACTESGVVNRGDVMADPRVHFVFWGSYWHSFEGVERADALVQSLARVAPAYFTGLSQYGVSTPKLVGMTVAAPPKFVGAFISQFAGIGIQSPYEPPLGVTEDAVVSMLRSEMQSGVIRPVHEVMRSVYYLVVLPPGRTAPHRGYHTYFVPLNGSPVWFAWISSTSETTADMFHELVEGMTDPEGRGVHSPCPRPSLWPEEICDLCRGETATVNGTRVPQYWSQKDMACIAPQS